MHAKTIILTLLGLATMATAYPADSEIAQVAGTSETGEVSIPAGTDIAAGGEAALPGGGGRGGGGRGGGGAGRGGGGGGISSTP